MLDRDRVLPNNVDAEVAVLGAMMLPDESVDVVPIALERLRGSDFYPTNHREIFKAISAVFRKGDPVDCLTVTRELKAAHVLERVGGVAYLDQMIDCIPSTANLEYYIDLVVEASQRRRVILTAAKIYNAGFDDELTTDELLSKSETAMLRLREQGLATNMVMLKDIVAPAIKHAEVVSSQQGGLLGVPTGFAKLDRMLSGWQEGDLILIGGRPSMGKSAFAQNVAWHAAYRCNVPVLIFSVEMSARLITTRILSAVSGIPLHAIRSDGVRSTDWGKFTMAADKVYKTPIVIDDTPGISLDLLQARCRQAYAQHQIKLVIIDYLQLIAYKGSFANRNEQVTEIGKGCKALARSLNVPVIALSQLSRKCEERTDKRPLLSDLRDSGSLEQDADVVMFVYRDGYYTKSDNPETELIISKHRNGPVGTVKLNFDGARMLFSSQV